MADGKESAKKEKKERKREKEEKKEKKKKRREVDQLVKDEQNDTIHQHEVKRMRTWSHDENDKYPGTSDNGAQTKRRRTRSMDVADEESSSKGQSTSEWRKEYEINVNDFDRSCNSKYDPYKTFEEVPFCGGILKRIREMKYDKPTSIQAQAWPIALAGRDMISIAKTGSGKTCGFLLPVFQKHVQNIEQNGTPRRSTPILLVLAPTRELAVQIQEQTHTFGQPLRIRSMCCYGGSSKQNQISLLQRGDINVVIATPGRLNDLLEMRKVDLSGIRYLVLDEADRMLDMGFEPQIRKIMAYLPKGDKKPQTMLFSATWPKEIQKLAFEFLSKPVQVVVGSLTEKDVPTANTDITQRVISCSENDKPDELINIMKSLMKDDNTNSMPKMIIFLAKKISCDEIANNLWNDGFAVDSIHGDRQQWERTKVINAFKSGVLKILVATDVAARGLDIRDVEVVINYDMPWSIEDYVHRIGRTGRAGKKGEAITLFTRGDNKVAGKLVDVLERAGQDVPDWIRSFVRPGHGRSGGWRGRNTVRSSTSGRGYMGGGGRGGRGGRFGGRRY